MDNLDTDLLILFDESVIKPKLNYLKENYKHNKLFKKLVRLCMQFKIKLYELLEDRFVVKNLEKIIKSCYQRRSDIIEKLAKSINNYNQLEKVVLSRKVKILINQESDKKTDSSTPEETFDIKAGIDKLYLEFKNESKILESLIDLIINNFSTNIIQSFYISKIQSTKYVEEYIS
jgi:hypothetical protein